MPFVYSKITNDTVYCDHVRNPGGDLPVINHQVMIKGGANRADKHIATPLGVMTEVSDKDLEFLKTNDGFLKHIERGFITVRNFKSEPEKVAQDMTERDNSAPLRPSDFTDEGTHPAVKKAPGVQDDSIVNSTRSLLQKLTGG